MLANERADYRPLRGSSRWRPSLHPVDNVLTEKQSRSAQDTLPSLMRSSICRISAACGIVSK